MRRVFVLLLLVLAPATALAQKLDVRVLLERTEEQLLVEVREAHRGFVDGRELFDTPLGITWPVSASNGRVLVDGTALRGPFTLAPRSAKVEWGGAVYRGALRFVARGEELLVINVLDIEEYLRGVVPAEMAAVWPLEALKAQAVASRTYTLVSLKPHSEYDICATVECQRYAGVAVEHLRSDRAVAETEGLVLTYQGDFARTYYHSDSGGSLASSAEVWGTSVPYLAARTDVAANSPHRSWQRPFDTGRLEAALVERGYHVGDVTAVRVSSYSESGRAQRAEIVGTSGRAILSGSTLTSVLRDGGLKSTRFTMIGDLVARGDGYGHGVGMSQYGARALAGSGYTFDGILHFYYPNTELQRLASRDGVGQR